MGKIGRLQMGIGSEGWIDFKHDDTEASATSRDLGFGPAMSVFRIRSTLMMVCESRCRLIFRSTDIDLRFEAFSLYYLEIEG